MRTQVTNTTECTCSCCGAKAYAVGVKHYDSATKLFEEVLKKKYVVVYEGTPFSAGSDYGELERIEKAGYYKDQYGLPFIIHYKNVLNKDIGRYIPTVQLSVSDRNKDIRIQKVGKDVCKYCGNETVFDPKDPYLYIYDVHSPEDLFASIKKEVGIQNVPISPQTVLAADELQQYLFYLIEIEKNIMYLEKNIKK